MIEDIKKDAQQRMKKSVEALQGAFNKIRTGRASSSILDTVMVPYYGQPTPLKQVANVTVEDARTLMITAWEKNLTPVIEKAIMSSDLGLNPSSNGGVIRVAMPMLTEETRKDMVRHARAEAEGARVSVRSIRRDANADLKELQKEKEITEDDERRGTDDIQKLTDAFIGEIDELLKKKEEDLMEV